MRVGDVAKRTGVSTRTLHHYDAIGLLEPSARSESGYRLYDEGDLLRLLQIKALRQLGFSLPEIATLLRADQQPPRKVIEQRIAALDREIELQRKMRDRLARIAEALDEGRMPSARQLTDAIEVITMFDKYFTAEQQEEIRKRGETLGAEHIRAVENEWPTLIAAVKKAMDNGTPPSDPEVQKLATCWMELVREFSGGNPAIEQSVGNMYRSESSIREKTGIDPAMFAFVRKALEESK